jgi:hypothetical protein
LIRPKKGPLEKMLVLTKGRRLGHPTGRMPTIDYLRCGSKY